MHSTDDFEYRASNIPTDVDLLEPLGLVMWAAIRLHHGIRDAIGSLTGIPSDEYFDETLGGANNTLKREVGKLSEGQLRTDLNTWCTDVAKPAIEARNGVAHAVAFTATDGQQALRGIPNIKDPERPYRYTVDNLLRVAGQLSSASASMPQIPKTDAN